MKTQILDVLHFGSPMRQLMKLGLALAMVLVMAASSFAIDRDTRLARDAEVLRRSRLPSDDPNYLSPFQEFFRYAANEAEFRFENPSAVFGVMGNLIINGEGSNVLTTPGQMLNFTFEYIKPDTDFTAPGPPTDAVQYWMSTTPDNPNSYIFLGQSSNSGNDFSFSFTAASFEGEIEAIPMFQFNDVVLPGLNGYNDAPGFGGMLLTPEPQSLLLLGSGLIGAGGFLRKRRLTRS